MTNPKTLIPEAHKLTLEDQSNGGKRSGEVRRENAIMRKTLEMMLSKTNSKGATYNENIALGLIANAIDRTKGGNPEAYKTIAKMLGELDTEESLQETPNVNITIVDNSGLEKTLYESDN